MVGALGLNAIDPGSNPVWSLIRGPFLESPETLRVIFGCHNSFVSQKRSGFKSLNLTVLFIFVTVKTC